MHYTPQTTNRFAQKQKDYKDGCLSPTSKLSAASKTSKRSGLSGLGLKNLNGSGLQAVLNTK